jgi:3-isopropylmalate dehydrogenase
MPGDDIGPEIVAAAVQVLKTADAVHGLGVRLTEIETGMASHRKNGTTLTEAALQAALDADGAIVGPAGITNYPPREQGGINVPATIRKRLDLYANLRPARFRTSLPDGRRDLDVLIARENTEGFYSDRNMFQGIAEFMPTEDVALAVRKITRQGSRRIAKVAFEYAMRRRKNVSAVGKQHALQVSDGLFMSEAYEMAKAYPDVAFREVDIDAMAADLYSRPERYDVILITNMFGDILSNEAAALAGGLGLSAALNAGDRHAVANAGHGSAPDIAGRGIANPAGIIVSTALLLEWLGVRHGKPAYVAACKGIQQAVDIALAVPEARTADLGGSGNTQKFADRVAAAVRKSG